MKVSIKILIHSFDRLLWLGSWQLFRQVQNCRRRYVENKKSMSRLYII